MRKILLGTVAILGAALLVRLLMEQGPKLYEHCGQWGEHRCGRAHEEKGASHDH
jgi:hypothetical protein